MGLSIDRQARFFAGLFVLLATIGGIMLDSRLHLLSAVVAVGLMFAAVTDICLLSLALAKMPWNQEPGPPFPIEPAKPAEPGKPAAPDKPAVS